MSKRFSASNAAMMMSCPASANLELAIPNWTPPVVDENAGAKGHGTKLHKIFEEVHALPTRDIRAIAEMFSYVADLRATRRFKVMTEAKITATWLPSQPSTTADLVLYTQDEIHVLDPKTGRIPVEAANNKQLMFYAVCFAPLAPKAKGVTLHILQPWADTGCHSWFADTNTLKQFMDEAIATDQKILAGDTTFGPSDDCKFCPAYPHSRSDKGKPLCPATMKLLYPPIVHEDEILAL